MEAKEIEDWVDSQMNALYEEAKELVEQFRAKNGPLNKAQSADQRSNLGCRARIVKGNLLIEWVKNQWRQGKEDGSDLLYSSRYIRKGTGDRYKPATLERNGRPWQLEMVLEYEQRFAEIRKQATALGKVRVAVRRYAKVTEAA